MDKWIPTLNSFKLSYFFLNRVHERKVVDLIDFNRVVGEKTRSATSSSHMKLIQFYKSLLALLGLMTGLFGISLLMIFIW